MGIDSTLNNYESSLDLDFVLDDLQDLPDDTPISIPTSTTLNHHHLTDYSALCIPTDSIEDIGWLLPSFSTTSFPFKTESLSFPGTPRSCLDVPTTPEQEIEFNRRKRDLQDVIQEEEHVFVNKKQRSKRIGRVWSTNVNAPPLLLPPKKRSCRHCGTEKTPQWREGPMGPKTLCNACGVRYKSGRLVPEYRPAASPTFNSQMHSNSHKKIVKMRMTRDF